MTPLDILGWVAATFGMASAFPQLIRILRTRSTAGVSLSLFQLNAASTGAWAMHGFLVGVPQMQYPNLVLTVSSLAVCVLVQRDRKKSLFPALLVPPLLALALFGTDLWLGPLVFGFIVAAPFVVGQVSQLRTMRSACDISGVSLPFLGVNFFVQGLWLIWGLLYGETSIIVCASLLGSLALINLAYFLHRMAQGTVVVDEVDAATSEMVFGAPADVESAS
ncbi:MAG: SemiSWEET family sugar transporter [Arachnia sp.]